MCALYLVWSLIRYMTLHFTDRRGSCPFRKRSLPFVRHLENIWPVIENAFLLKERKSQPRAVKPGPRTRTFRFLSLSLTTTLPHRPAKIPKKLSTYTSKPFFLTVTSIAGDPSSFHKFHIKFNLGFNFVPSTTLQKRTIYLIQCNFIQSIYYIQHD